MSADLSVFQDFDVHVAGDRLVMSPQAIINETFVKMEFYWKESSPQDILRGESKARVFARDYDDRCAKWNVILYAYRRLRDLVVGIMVSHRVLAIDYTLFYEKENTYQWMRRMKAELNIGMDAQNAKGKKCFESILSIFREARLSYLMREPGLQKLRKDYFMKMLKNSVRYSRRDSVRGGNVFIVLNEILVSYLYPGKKSADLPFVIYNSNEMKFDAMLDMVNLLLTKKYYRKMYLTGLENSIPRIVDYMFGVDVITKLTQ